MNERVTKLATVTLDDWGEDEHGDTMIFCRAPQGDGICLRRHRPGDEVSLVLGSNGYFRLYCYDHRPDRCPT